VTTPDEEKADVIHAPATYAKLSEPFESNEAINEAWFAFQKELYELRKKHRVRDLTLVLGGSFVQDGEPAEARITMHFGSSLNKLPALAFAYGEAKAEQTAMLAEAELAGARRGNRRK
jgi:hypothetical protein